MNINWLRGALAALLIASGPVAAQTASTYTNADRSSSAGVVITTSTDGVTSQAVTPATPLPVTCISGCSGGGGGSDVNIAEVGGVTVSSVPINDAGGSITVDGSVSIEGQVGVTGTVNIGTAPTIAVTGAFYPATQPVSGTVSVTGSVAVTGAYQATQPVSLASAPTTPVTGTFWQATQPVSAASLPLPTGAMGSTGGTVGLVAGAAVIGHVINDASSAVIGHVVVDTAPTTAVTLATAPALVASSAVIGHVIVDTAPTTAVTQSGTWTAQIGNTPNTTAILANPNQAQPSGATQESCSSGNVAAGTTACTLATAVGKTTFIAGFSMTASGATAGLAVNCTVTGLVTGTQTYIFTYPAGVLVGAVPLNVTFSPPVPASATNTTIVASCPSGGSGAAHAAMNAWGYQL